MTVSTRSLSVPISQPFADQKTAMVLGLSAALLGTLFVLALAIFSAVVVLVLAGIENEPFLLGVIFFLPVGWFARTSVVL